MTTSSLTIQWPKQSDVRSYYGNPSGANGGASPTWERANLVLIEPPFPLVTAWEPHKSVSKIRIHTKCAHSLIRVLHAIWEAAGHDMQLIRAWGMDQYGGAYTYRLTRGGTSLSMHSYGCAIDFDPMRNAYGSKHPHFRECPEVLRAFCDEGWVWGGNWRKPDGMHWQAAII